MSKDREQKISVSPELAEDPDYIAYKAQESDLKANHMGKWVAFHGGELVAIEDSRDSLLTQVFEKTGETGCLVKHIVPKERTIHMRSPRRVSRTP